MATLVSFHAHPDDESIATGGVIAKAASEGHRVVLVFGTRGENGEYPEGFLDAGEDLADRRVKETLAAAEILGSHRVEWLGYRDSGMDGTDTNNDARSFHLADVDEAAQRLANILQEESADVLTTYDAGGGYGHPDHVKVHVVGHRAAEIARTPCLYEATMNRNHFVRLLEDAKSLGIEDLPDPSEVGDFGVPEDQITTTVDVTDFLGVKRNAMRAHASQITETSFFLTMPEDVFRTTWGTEWFIRVGAPPGTRESSLFD